MSAAERIATLDELPAVDLVAFAEGTLSALVRVMNNETMLLRAGRYRDSIALGAEKTRLAQDYVTYSRAIQRQLARIMSEAPNEVIRLRQGHEQLATQMAENLKVIATARAVTEDVLIDVAASVGRQGQTKTYGATGELPTAPRLPGTGIAVNRAG
ncbi:MAG: hypothetical protein ABL879_06365 [Devosia sp.]